MSRSDLMTEMTAESLQTVKQTAPLFNEIQKLALKYSQAAETLAQIGIQLSESIITFAQTYDDGVSGGLQSIADMQNEIEVKRRDLGKMFGENFAGNLKTLAENSKKEEFEKNYSRDVMKAQADIQKLEHMTKKAGKKVTPDYLQSQLTLLNDKVKEAETLKQVKLREVIRLQRKKYCSLLIELLSIAGAEKDMFERAGSVISQKTPLWRSLANSGSQIPEFAVELCSETEQTFTQIDAVPEDPAGMATGSGGIPPVPTGPLPPIPGGAASIPAPVSDFPPPPPMAAASNEFSAVALYDYTSEEADDLHFYVNQVVIVTETDPNETGGEGWWRGKLEDNPKIGLFPKDYVSPM